MNLDDWFAPWRPNIHPVEPWTINAVDTGTPYIKIKENKEMELLNIYFEKKRDLVYKKYEIKAEKIKAKNEEYKELTEIMHKYKDNDCVSIYVSSNYPLGKELDAELKKVFDDKNNELQKLSDLKIEIEAQLELCETYEQKMNMLKTYQIVKDNGVLNIQ
jgi:hypothetical protein